MMVPRAGAFSALLVACQVLGCNDVLPSHTVWLRLVDVSRDAMGGSDPLQGFEVEAMKQSFDRPPDDEMTLAYSDADGVVELRLGEFDYTIFIIEPDRMGVTAHLRVSGEHDLRATPTIVPPRIFDGTNDFCGNQLGVSGVLASGVSASWMRVYSSGAALSPSDTLRVEAANEDAIDVSAGEDLVDAVTANGSQHYVDIYRDSRIVGDQLGHKNAELWSHGEEGMRTDYAIDLNGASRTLEIRPCGKGVLNVVYF